MRNNKVLPTSNSIHFYRFLAKVINVFIIEDCSGNHIFIFYILINYKHNIKILFPSVLELAKIPSPFIVFSFYKLSLNDMCFSDHFS